MEIEFSQGYHNLLEKDDIKVGAVATVQLHSQSVRSGRQGQCSAAAGCYGGR